MRTEGISERRLGPRPDKRGGFYRSMRHHLIDVRFKDGVYERREAIETLSHTENGCLAAVEEGQSLHEIGRVYGRWHNSIRSVLLPRGGIPPGRSSPFAAGAHAS